ncbi:uncharacterized protein CLUP02_01367 [Colletotrichum lupini]|uniref:Uncharacterized protein n=1 Tax=Colletotrichum lupini TaxID=145971 RepID=A0A9Q8SCK2_9PEZI|nr:uncharacterized protein CLUP02_01367 [Colletotrichum lupini]UQC74715.1 hypothetical protein CLUP02_01367 [Colletotrichum lupini]
MLGYQHYMNNLTGELVHKRKSPAHGYFFGVFGASNSMNPSSQLVGYRLWAFNDVFVFKRAATGISVFRNRSTGVAQVRHKAVLGTAPPQACVLSFSPIFTLLESNCRDNVIGTKMPQITMTEIRVTTGKKQKLGNLKLEQFLEESSIRTTLQAVRVILDRTPGAKILVISEVLEALYCRVVAFMLGIGNVQTRQTMFQFIGNIATDRRKEAGRKSLSFQSPSDMLVTSRAVGQNVMMTSIQDQNGKLFDGKPGGGLGGAASASAVKSWSVIPTTSGITTPVLGIASLVAHSRTLVAT